MTSDTTQEALESLKEETLDAFVSCTNTEQLLLLTFIDWLKKSEKLKLTKRKMIMTDTVNHPKHYNGHPSGVECITRGFKKGHLVHQPRN